MALSPKYVASLIANGDLEPDWTRLPIVLQSAIQRQMPTWTEPAVQEFIEEHLDEIELALRIQLTFHVEDGESPSFEIDDDTPPFIRSGANYDRSLVRRLCKLNPLGFENLCADLLVELGCARAQVTSKSWDGGVDFIGYNFLPKKAAVLLPDVAKGCVIGQAKCHKFGKRVNETDIRSFVGGGMLWEQRLRKRKQIRTLTPVTYAFWSTGVFEFNAKRYARKMGIWHMNGPTMASLVSVYGLETDIERYNDPAFRRHPFYD